MAQQKDFTVSVAEATALNDVETTCMSRPVIDAVKNMSEENDTPGKRSVSPCLSTTKRAWLTHKGCVLLPIES